MKQTWHLQFRYLQRVQKMTNKDEINQHIKENYYKVYHDINEMFTNSKVLVENWKTFNRDETFSYFIHNHKYLFVVESRKSEGRTIISIGDNKVVGQAIHRIALINDQIKKLDKLKREVDARTRSMEWLAKTFVIDLSEDTGKTVNQAKEYVEQIKSLKSEKKELVYGLAVDYEVLLEQIK
jgi:glutamate mutase epsilon subunit